MAIIFVAGVFASHDLVAAGDDIATIIAQELELDQEQTGQLRAAMKNTETSLKP